MNTVLAMIAAASSEALQAGPPGPSAPTFQPFNGTDYINDVFKSVRWVGNSSPSEVQVGFPMGTYSLSDWANSGAITSRNYHGGGVGGPTDQTIICVVSNSATAIRSTDGGATWSDITMPGATTNWRAVSCGPVGSAVGGGRRWVAVSGAGGKGAYSDDDGATWTETTLPASVFYSAVTYGSGRWVAVSGASNNQPIYSTDGITWANTSGTLPSTQVWNMVRFANGRFIAVCSGTAQLGAYSTNGDTWTQFTIGTTSNLTWNDVVYDATRSRWVAIDISASKRVAYSTDNGSTWTTVAAAVTFPSFGTPACITECNGIYYVSASNTNVVQSSEDGGLTWCNRAVMNTSGRIILTCNGKIVVVGASKTVARLYTVPTVPYSGKWMVMAQTDSSASYVNQIYDNVRGYGLHWATPGTAAQTSVKNELCGAHINGFNVGDGGGLNANTIIQGALVLKAASKFLDIVTYTGNGSSSRNISHALGVAPGMVWVRAVTSGASTYDTQVWHRSIADLLKLNLNSAASANTNLVTGASSSTFTVGTNMNTNGVTYMAYVFAHDDSSSGAIQCGTFSGSSGNVSLGWEPQLVLWKQSSSTTSWRMCDVVRGLNYGVGSTAVRTDLTSAPAAIDEIYPTATGFQFLNTSGTMVYMAIRRPNKDATSTGQVLGTALTNGTGAAMNFNFSQTADLTYGGLLWTKCYNQTDNWIVAHTSRPIDYFNYVNSAGGIATGGNLTRFMTNGVSIPAGGSPYNNVGYSYGHYGFVRTPAYFEMASWTGNGTSSRSIAHALGKKPVMVLVKARAAANDWAVYHTSLGAGKNAILNSTALPTTDTTHVADVSTTDLTVGSAINTNGVVFDAFIFGGVTGSTKAFSYTGNGTTQDLDFGFSGSARWLLIRRVTGVSGNFNWMVFDAARGINAGNDPPLALNLGTAPLTAGDYVDTFTGGITVNEEATYALNTSGASYIGYAIA